MADQYDRPLPHAQPGLLRPKKAAGKSSRHRLLRRRCRVYVPIPSRHSAALGRKRAGAAPTPAARSSGGTHATCLGLTDNIFQQVALSCFVPTHTVIIGADIRTKDPIT